MKIMMRRITFCILTVVVIGIQVYCAKQGFPPGGPVDKRPPFVVSTVPASNAVNVPLDTQIEIRFSEPVQKQSVEGAVFITPNPGRDMKYKWRGKRLRLRLPGQLRTNRTYVITIGTGVKDMRNNAMAKSFTLAFSTGADLDVCEIAGNVFGEGRVEGTQIWAFDLAENSMPDPSSQEPLYVTQAGAQGDYLFTNLATGRYRAFAVIDRDVNQTYDPEYDALGVASKDIELNEKALRVTDVNFKLAVRDTTKPTLVSAAATDRHHIDLKFSESLMPTGISDSLNYIIFAGMDTLRIIEVYLDERNPSYVHLVNAGQKDSVEYTVRVGEFCDLAGHALDTSGVTVSFQGIGVPDTTQPKIISITPPDSSIGIALDSPIEIFFSEPMDRASIETELTISDSLGNSVPGSFDWPNGVHMIFTADSAFKSLMAYSLSMPVDSVFDLFSNALSDTLFHKIFTTLNKDTLTEISGSVIDPDSSAQGDFFLTAKSVERGGAVYERQIPADGKYVFPNILPGIYRIELFRDEDGNGRYSYGEAVPFVPAERFYVYPDSIKVRSRWPNEGNDIFMPK